MLRTVSRRAVLALGAMITAFRAGGAEAARPTPPQTKGPFYPPPDDRPGDQDWDLVRVEGRVRLAGGRILHLSGRVLGIDGRPVADARVEIWQCDVNGRYLHHRDRGSAPRDPDFQGFGAVLTDADGRYRFRTIRPVAYPGRTPHIHCRVVPPGRDELITQLYMADEPLNARDGIYRSLGASAQAAVTVSPRPGTDGDLVAEFDFVV